jgi:hypothetical protein
LYNIENSFKFNKNCQVNSIRLKTTGEIIRVQKKTKRLLLRQVAAQLDLGTEILSKIEPSETKATKRQIAKLADILRLHKDNLLLKYLSEKITYEIADDDLANLALRFADKK